MRKLRYLFILLWVGIPSIVQLGIFIVGWLGVNASQYRGLTTVAMMGGAIPTPFIVNIPWQFRAIIFLLVLFLLINRIWHFFKVKGVVVPSTFSGFSSLLGTIAFISFVSSAVLFALTIILTQAGASSGVPTGLAIIPAMFCAPLSFFITELWSFKKSESINLP